MPGWFYSSCFSHKSGAHSGHLSIENAPLASVETYTLVHYLNWFTPHLITTVLASERALSNNLFHCFEFQLTEGTIVFIIWHFTLFQKTAKMSIDHFWGYFFKNYPKSKTSMVQSWDFNRSSQIHIFDCKIFQQNVLYCYKLKRHNPHSTVYLHHIVKIKMRSSKV